MQLMTHSESMHQRFVCGRDDLEFFQHLSFFYNQLCISTALLQNRLQNLHGKKKNTKKHIERSRNNIVFVYVRTRGTQTSKTKRGRHKSAFLNNFAFQLHGYKIVYKTYTEKRKTQKNISNAT